jgi:hypothetical protein
VQAAFWIELQRAFQGISYTRSVADPCLYVQWDEDGELCIWLTWIYSGIVIGNENVVARESAKLVSLFDCEDVGPMEEYIGNKIKTCSKRMKLTQPVLLQSLTDDFGVVATNKACLPAKTGQVLTKSEECDVLDERERTKYRSGVGKLQYLATWSKPDVLNAMREVSRHMQAPNKTHYYTMINVMKYCVSTPTRGRKLDPMEQWDSNKNFEFVISGMSDSDFNHVLTPERACQETLQR